MSIDAVVERVSEGGNLLASLALIEPGTWQTSQEVFRDWQNGAPVQGVNTANLGIYRIVNGEVVFDLLGREGNLFVDERFRKDTYKGILSNDLFVLPEEMRAHVMDTIKGGHTVSVRYSGLRTMTKGCGDHYCYVKSGEGNTDGDKKLFTGVYGLENPGEGKKIFLLREKVVKSQLKKNKDEFIARACCFYGNRDFLAIYLDIDYYGAVRGARRKVVAEGDAQKDKVMGAYQTLIATPPHELTKLMVEGLSKLVTNYLGSNNDV